MSLTNPQTRDNDAWLHDLAATGELRQQAIQDLRRILLDGLRRGLSRWLPAGSEQLLALAEETTQEALLRILDHLHTFEGRSKFTTWAYKVGLNLALSELRRKQWQDVSLDQMLAPEPTDLKPFQPRDKRPGPEATVERRDLLQRIERIMRDELSPDQLAMLRAVAVDRVPMEALAQKLGIKRNALYKRLHDARLKLKRRMALEGVDLDELLSVQDQGKNEEDDLVRRKDE